MYRLPKIAFASLMLVACERAEPAKVAPMELPVSAEIPVEKLVVALPPAPPPLPAVATPIAESARPVIVEKAKVKSNLSRKAATSQHLKAEAPPEAIAKPAVEVFSPAGISRRGPIWTPEQQRTRVTITKVAPTDSPNGESP